MTQKNKVCLWCGERFNELRSDKVYCNGKHRSYYNRHLKFENAIADLITAPLETNTKEEKMNRAQEVKNLVYKWGRLKKKHNYMCKL